MELYNISPYGTELAAKTDRDDRDESYTSELVTETATRNLRGMFYNPRIPHGSVVGRICLSVYL